VTDVEALAAEALEQAVAADTDVSVDSRQTIATLAAALARNGYPDAAATAPGRRYTLLGRETQPSTREAAAEQAGRAYRWQVVDECRRCGQAFLVHGAQRYCSIECARLVRNERRRVGAGTGRRRVSAPGPVAAVAAAGVRSGAFAANSTNLKPRISSSFST
jgi:hypothetical protein